MTPRTSCVATLAIVAVLAVLAGPARADPEPHPLAEPPALEEPLKADDGTFDVTARLRGSRDGLSLEVGGARLEFRIVEEPVASGPPLGGSAPGAHDFRASFSVDGKVTNLLFRFVPPAGETQPPNK